MEGRSSSLWLWRVSFEGSWPHLPLPSYISSCYFLPCNHPWRRLQWWVVVFATTSSCFSFSSLPSTAAVAVVSSSPSYGCLAAYKEGGAPAVFAPSECAQWTDASMADHPVLVRSSPGCHPAVLQGRRHHMEDRTVCALDIPVPFLGIYINIYICCSRCSVVDFVDAMWLIIHTSFLLNIAVVCCCCGDVIYLPLFFWCDLSSTFLLIIVVVAMYIYLFIYFSISADFSKFINFLDSCQVVV